MCSETSVRLPSSPLNCPRPRRLHHAVSTVPWCAVAMCGATVAAGRWKHRSQVCAATTGIATGSTTTTIVGPAPPLLHRAHACDGVWTWRQPRPTHRRSRHGHRATQAALQAQPVAPVKVQLPVPHPMAKRNGTGARAGAMVASGMALSCRRRAWITRSARGWCLHGSAAVACDCLTAVTCPGVCCCGCVAVCLSPCECVFWFSHALTVACAWVRGAWLQVCHGF